MIGEKEIPAAQVEFETVACPLCAGRSYKMTYTFFDGYGSYSLVQCSDCGFQFLNPRPTAATIGIYYDAQNYTPFLSSGKSGSVFNRMYSWIRNYSVAWKRRKIEQFRKTGYVLDIGCGTGEFLREMSLHNWETKGLEPSKEASGFARTAYGLDVTTGFVDEQSLHSIRGPFDVITMWHALEHLHMPADALNILKEKLSDNGLLVIAVPNVSSYDAGVYGKDWVALDVPRHLLHFTPSTMKNLLSSAGMEVVEQHQMPLDTVFNSAMSEKSIIVHHARIKAPFYMLRLLLTILLSWINGFHEDKGSSVMYYVRKKG